MKSSLEKCKNDILFSVIIPVYNVEQYVGECLLSVITQQKDNIEIIIVDDGSTDQSFQICKNIVGQFQNNKIKIIQQGNKGLSAARNVGMNVAVGEFIIFLDSDDLLKENAISTLAMYVGVYYADLYLYDATIKNELPQKVNLKEFQRNFCVESRIMSGVEYMANWYFHPPIFPVYLSVFRTSYVRKKGFLFTVGKYHEDISFSFKTVLYAEKVIYIPVSLYIRRLRPNSITTIKMSNKNYEGVLTAYEECIKIYAGFENKTEALSNAVVHSLCGGLEYVMQICKECEGDKTLAIRLYEMFFEILLIQAVPISYRGYTWLSSLAELIVLGIKYDLNISGEILEKIIPEEKTYSAILKKINELRERQREKILKGFGLEKASLVVGVYGTGNHSRSLIEQIRKYYNINAKLYFINSAIMNSGEHFMGYDVFNEQDIPKDTNKIILSSYAYHGELVMKCRKMLMNTKIRFIDPYEIEDYPLDIINISSMQ